ncbi:MAG: AAA family ATPase [Bacteroidales bacterium]|nr:AAA family ATPase [Bacteroidales bacterium]
MNAQRVRYPVGQQSFRRLRESNCVYVDKTHFIPELIWTSSFIFLSRPRRFGKSLLLSTLEAYFQGEKELFEGLYIAQEEKEWIKYPVLHFDMTRTSGQTANEMTKFLLSRFEEFEKAYDLEARKDVEDVGDRFSTLIKSVYDKTGLPVVILIDEYDKGILETMDDPERLEKMSVVLRAFYSQPKAMSDYVHFCMVTGVARFPNYTLFSGPNNFTDISLNEDFAAICGLTQEEVIDNFSVGIEAIGERKGWTFDETVEALRLKYDSYRFTASLEKVYNPFSLLNAFTHKALGNYWIKSGISKVFTKYFSSEDFDLLELQNLWVDQARMEDIFRKDDHIPLLFQTGYLTIVDSRGDSLYRLAIPNGEVRSAFIDQILPHYTGISEKEIPLRLQNLKDKFAAGDIDGWFKDLRAMVSKIPHHLFVKPKKTEDDEMTEDELRIAHLEATYHIIVNVIFIAKGDAD